MKIQNLYKYQDILMFKECYAMEKIHGTSAHISFKKTRIPDGVSFLFHKTYAFTVRTEPSFINNKKIPGYTDCYEIKFFSGGEKHSKFITLFDSEALTKVFAENVDCDEMTIFGEAYGGKQQGMSHTYGKELKFIVFDVKIGHVWLDVPKTHKLATKFGLEFVHYVKCTTDMQQLNFFRDTPSVQAIRNGCGDSKLREGVVLRPLIEVRKNNGSRVIAKHKNENFSEVRTPRQVDTKKLQVLEEAEAIANEWVTPNRLKNLLSHMNPDEIDMKNTPKVIKAMIDDVKIEGEGEIEWGKPVRHAVGKRTAKLFQQYFKDRLNNG